RRHTRSTRDWSSDVCSSDLFHCRSACKYVLFSRTQYANSVQRCQSRDTAIFWSTPATVGVQGFRWRGGVRAEPLPDFVPALQERSEERRVGKERRAVGAA